MIDNISDATNGRRLDLSRFDTGGVENADSPQQISTYLFPIEGSMPSILSDPYNYPALKKVTQSWYLDAWHRSSDRILGKLSNRGI